MILSVGEYTISPSNARLLLRTYRKGVAQSVGHDLVLEAGSWSGLVVVGESLADCSVSGSVDIDSIAIVETSGGVKALSDKDRQDIDAELRKQLGAAEHPQATFASSSVTASDTDGSVAGTFTVGGAPAPLTLTVARTEPGRFMVSAVVAQTAHGIKPFSAFFGALKLRDEVDVEIQVDLTGGA